MTTTTKKPDCVVGVDIGGTKIVAAVMDRQFNILSRCKKRTKATKKDDPTEARLCRVVEKAIKDSRAEIVGIGVGSPGPLDPETGVIIDTPNLAWKDFPLADTLSKEFGVSVVVDNDVNVGTFGEWSFGEVRQCTNVVGIFPGTGIGGGIIVDGKILHGFSGAAGEIGHMTVQIDGPYCGCGKRGCLEAVASRIAIAEQVAALSVRGDAPHIQEQAGGDLTKIRSGMIAGAIEAGDKMVEGVVRKAAHYVGIAAANLINILSPEAVVLGGGLVEAMEEIYLDEVKRAVKIHAMPFLRKGVRIVCAKLADDAVVLGAGKLITERLKGTK